MASPYKPSCKQAFAPKTKKLALKNPQQQLHRPNKTTTKNRCKSLSFLVCYIVCCRFLDSYLFQKSRQLEPKPISLNPYPTFAISPSKWCPRNERMRRIPYRWSDTTKIWLRTSDWSFRKGNFLQPIKSTTQFWVVTCDKHSISSLLPPMVYPRRKGSQQRDGKLYLPLSMALV